jgi:hypothetical protein
MALFEDYQIRRVYFTALAELSTCQLAEHVNATGMTENQDAAKKGGRIAKKPRKDLKSQTGQAVVSGESFLPSGDRVSHINGANFSKPRRVRKK